jgi:hypothetical protein
LDQAMTTDFQDALLRRLYGQAAEPEEVSAFERFKQIAAWLDATATTDHVETLVGGWRFTMTRPKREP